MDISGIATIVICGGGLALYIWWKWRRAGEYVAASERAGDAARFYFDSLRAGPRWTALQAKLEEKYSVSFDHRNTPPGAFVVHEIALLSEDWIKQRIENVEGPVYIAGILIRKQPSTRIIVRMNLQTGQLLETESPNGQFIGPPR